MSNAKDIKEYLIEWTNERRTAMETILDSKGSNATGNLRASLNWRVRVFPNSIECVLEAADYWVYIDMGVEGTESGHSMGGFKFKNPYPNRKMIASIQEWIAYKAIPIRESAEQSTESVIDRARKIAAAMSVGVKKRGIKATMFFSDNINEPIFNQLANDMLENYGKEVFARFP
jgi:hypothetical protein